jgi:hypothetical protein
MTRSSQIVLAALVAATVAAFFIAQHLKSTTPIIAGDPHPSPSAIAPGSTACGGKYKRMLISFYLLHRADDVDVFVVDSSGAIVRTLATGRHMRRGVRNPDGDFGWNGREDNGTLAPDGAYHVKVVLIHQNRTYTIPSPVRVITQAPRPRVTGVSVAGKVPAILPASATAPSDPHGAGARITYSGNEHRNVDVLVYRTDVTTPHLVKRFVASSSPAYWDGKIAGSPAPAGTYLVGLEVTDAACNTGTFPPQFPPVPGSTPHSGVTVTYLDAAPPVDPVAGGARAHVFVDSRQRPYTWALRLAGDANIVHGGAGHSAALNIPLPAHAGLYELAIRSGTNRTAVPIVAHGPRSHGPRILVVLPALTWQGQNPVDGDGDGLPDTLGSGDTVGFERPFAQGLPQGFADEAALLTYLDHAHLAYDLTTDIGLIDGVGPGLSGHTGIVLAGSERWLPPSLGAPLRAYARKGLRVLSLGLDSLRRSVAISGSGLTGQASSPTEPAVADALGATTGPFVARTPGVILSLTDGAGIFTGTSNAFPDFTAYEPITGTVPPAGKIASAAGPGAGAVAIAGFPYGAGLVVEVGVQHFGSLLGSSVDAQELVRGLWTLLSR